MTDKKIRKKTPKKKKKKREKNKKEEDEPFLFDHDIEIGRKKITKKKGIEKRPERGREEDKETVYFFQGGNEYGCYVCDYWKSFSRDSGP